VPTTLSEKEKAQLSRSKKYRIFASIVFSIMHL
jgi:hypothetical protein